MRKRFWNLFGWKQNNRGMGTVEMILIIVVIFTRI